MFERITFGRRTGGSAIFGTFEEYAPLFDRLTVDIFDKLTVDQRGDY